MYMLSAGGVWDYFKGTTHFSKVLSLQIRTHEIVVEKLQSLISRKMNPLYWAKGVTQVM